MSATTHSTYQPMSQDENKAAPLALTYWLWTVAAMVFCIIIVGGITRLTESGLSITEWKPITGALPPLNEADWLAEFELYKTTTEFQTEHSYMTLADFKFIYFWEWVHRFIARTIGLAFALPMIWFWVRGMIPQGYKPRLLGLLALGAFQGFIGWWMVSSGLFGRTDVSHYRLAIHLLTALTILSGLIWTIRDLRNLAHISAPPRRMNIFGWCVIGALFVQLLFGAWVAGLNAGYVANTWPLMNDLFYPAGVIWDGGFFAALSSDPILTHFIHRWWAWGVAAALGLLALRTLAKDKLAAALLLLLLALQISLGIATVISGVAINLAVWHQAVGALLVGATIWAVHIQAPARQMLSHSRDSDERTNTSPLSAVKPRAAG
jgi:cytochrome c oxidase assembly protein subunit 15